METILRAVVVYLLLLALFRSFGKRSLSQITTFDFVLLLIVAETTQQALLGDDYSIVNCLLLVATLLLLDRLLSFLKQRSVWFESVAEGRPLVILRDGAPLRDHMERCDVDESDILAAAREAQGLERLDQIKYAILERNGSITVVPVDPKG